MNADSNVTPLKRVRKCPICRKLADNRYHPFCSKRCADIDLGRWLGERYALSGEPAPVPGDDEGEY